MILQIVKHAKKNRKVKAILLFGSHAKGKATPISDVDICIIGNKLSEMEKSKLELLSDEKVEINFFDKLPLPVRFRVFKEGKIIFLRDEKFF